MRVLQSYRHPFRYVVAGLMAVLFLSRMVAAGEGRLPANRGELRYWLENMVVWHDFSVAEVEAATGLPKAQIEADLREFGIVRGSHGPAAGNLRMAPYPGGRHPRIGFLDGAVNPQRETKISIFTPWDPASYVVADVPEAIWCQKGLLYLAHTHVATVWTKENVVLPRLEWNRREDGSLEIERVLPNGVAFGAKAVAGPNAIRMELWLRNGSKEPFSDLRVQNCVMLKGARGFTELTNTNKVISNPYVACRSDDGKRWVISAWTPCHRPWANAPVPCLHSDPKFPDCAPGETKRLRGWLSFYEGTDIRAEFKRIESLKWEDARL